ncbi:MAG: exosortase/archaeosortase family protein [Verrucomicrobia bacterium]|nr:exosortase/archaeosortase family protein [Verrucomicrobiota bacterium]
MESLKQLPRTFQYAALALIAMVVFVAFDQSHWWGIREEYMFGYLVPLFVIYIIYERWPKLQVILLGSKADLSTSLARDYAKELEASQACDAKWLNTVATFFASCAVLGGLVLYLFGAAYRAAEGNSLVATFGLSIGFSAILLGTIYLFSDENADGERIPAMHRLRLSAWFIFPALIWLLSAPMFDAMERAISTFLLDKVAFVVFHTFDMLGFAIVREGSILQLPKGPVGVEDACSGIRSLMACLFAGSFLGAVFLDKFWKKVFMVGMAMFFAFIMNIFRSLFLTSWAYAYGSESIAGTVHDVTGYAVLGLTVVGLLALLPIFNYQWETELTETGSEAT